MKAKEKDISPIGKLIVVLYAHRILGSYSIQRPFDCSNLVFMFCGPIGYSYLPICLWMARRKVAGVDLELIAESSKFVVVELLVIVTYEEGWYAKSAKD